MKRKPKYITKEQAQLICPCCQEVVRPALTRLQQMESRMDTRWLDGSSLVDKAIKKEFNEWACMNCERAGRAIFPHYNKQNYGLGGPILFYITKEMNCETCKKDFTFTAEDQRFWYEDLYFNYSSYPKNCLSCRKETRQKKLLHKKLAELLHDDLKTADHMLAIAKVYEQLEIGEKAALYLTRAKNLDR
jgi:hypothetical protein